MIAIPIQRVENTILFYKADIDTFIDDAEQKLIKIRDSGKLIKAEQVFIIKIINYGVEKIVLAKPTEIETYRTAIGKIPKNTRPKVKGKKSFKDELLECFGYSRLRSEFYPKYFQKIGIKACVYCNSQLTVSVEAKNKQKYQKKIPITLKAKFQVDHYYSKATYPYLSISFFNLYPVCASCNNSKRDYQVDFNLYSSNPNHLRRSDFHFKFCKGSVAKYKLSRNIDDIKYIFIEPNTRNHRFNNLFDIEGIYDTQKDIAEELIIKSEIYTKSYKDSLIHSFGQILNNSNINNRIIVGNYIEPENIHKRPMAKFMQDLAFQLGLPVK